MRSIFRAVVVVAVLLANIAPRFARAATNGAIRDAVSSVARPRAVTAQAPTPVQTRPSNAFQGDSNRASKQRATQRGKAVTTTKAHVRVVDRDSAWQKSDALKANYAFTPPVGERVLVEVHIGRFASQSVLAFEQPDGELLVPVLPILKLAGISAKLKNETLQGRQSNVGPKFSFDARSKELRHGNESWFVPHTAVARDSEGLWVSVPFLRRLIGVDASYDQSSADLEIRDGERFPVGVRALRNASIIAQRARLSGAEETLTPSTSTDSENYAQRSRAVVVDYQFTHNVQPTAILASGVPAQNDFETALGTSFPVFGGVMNARMHTFNSFGGVDGSAWWTMNRSTTKLFSEFSIGEVRTRGFQSRTVRGFSITNGSPVPDLDAGQTQYALRLPANWQLDAFRGSNLISSSTRTGGEHRLPVSLSYGTNTIDFIAHGPDGQERLFQRSFHTPSMYVTPHAVDYALAAGLCEETAVCLARMNADVRIGLASNFVARVGIDGRLGSLRTNTIVPTAISGSALIPYIGLSTVVHRSTVIDASIQPAVGSSARSDGAIQIRYEPNPDFILSSDASLIHTPIYNTPVVESPLGVPTSAQRVFGNWMRSRRLSGYLHYAPSIVNDRVSIEAWTSLQSWNAAKAASSRVGLSTQVKAFQFRPYVRWDLRRLAGPSNAGIATLVNEIASVSSTTRAYYQGVDATYVPTFARAASFGEWWLRGGLETRSSRVDNWTASVTRAVGRWRVDAAMLKRSGLPGRSWTLSLVSELPQLQVSNFSASSTANSRATMVTQVQGSAIYDGDLRRLTLSAEPATGRSGVAGVVFLDANGDGVRQDEEATIPDVQLYVNNKSLVTDKRGTYMLWGLPGYAVQQILVDTSSLSNPNWIPVQPFSAVRTLAGTLVTADIPVVVAGMLHGSIRALTADSDVDSAHRASPHADSVPAGTRWSRPLQLVLVNVRTGSRRVVDTFSDGTFYEEGLAPGEYLVSVDAASLNGTGLVSGAVKTQVLPGRGTSNANLSAQGPPSGATVDETDGALVLWLRPEKR